MNTAGDGQATSVNSSGRVTNATIAAYAIAGMGPNFLYSLVTVMYLYFATVHLGVSPAVVGMVFFACKIWDAVSDPMTGFLSDRTRSRLGRRRIWLLASTAPFAVFSWMIWAPPADLDATWLSVWIAFAIWGFYTAYTAFEVPHMALGAELSFVPAARNRIFGARYAARIVAMLAAFTGGVWIVSEGSRGWVSGMGVALGIASAISIIWCVSQLPAERADFQRRTSSGPFTTSMHVWANPHARLVLMVTLIEAIGMGALSALIPFMVQYILKMPTFMMAAALVVFLGCQLISIPVWLRLARRFEKRRLWLFAMFQAAFGYGLLLLLSEGAWPFLIAQAIICGLAGGAGATLGPALKADVIDVDEYRTGERKEGAYFAAWAFMSKLGNGVMVGAAGIVLELSGFDRALAVQDPQVEGVMLLLVGGFPLLCFTIGGLMFMRFRLSEAEHARIRRELDGRHNPASQ